MLWYEYITTFKSLAKKLFAIFNRIYRLLFLYILYVVLIRVLIYLRGDPMRRSSFFVVFIVVIFIGLFITISIKHFQLQQENENYEANILYASEDLAMNYEEFIGLQEAIIATQDSSKKDLLLNQHFFSHELLLRQGNTLNSLITIYEKHHKDSTLPSFYDGEMSKNVRLSMLLSNFREAESVEERIEITNRLKIEIQEFKDYIDLLEEELNIEKI